MDRAAHAMLTAGVTTVFHPLVYAKTLIQVLKVTLKHGLYPPPPSNTKGYHICPV